MESFRDTLYNWRTFLDCRLLLEEFPRDFAILALLGFLIGMVTAYIMWYRSARLIRSLEAERVSLTSGDIDINEEVKVESQSLAARTSIPEEVEISEPKEIEAEPEPVQPVVETNQVEEEVTEIEEAAEVPVEPPPAEVKNEAEEEEFQFRNAFTEAPEDPDDLTLLEGIDKEKARELNRSGIFKFSQLEDLDEEERRQFGFRFGWTDINWGGWGITAATAACGAALTGRDRPEPEESSPVETTTEANSSPEVFTFEAMDVDDMDDSDDLTLLEGVDDVKAEALRRAGIYKFSQLETLSEEDREQLESRFNWPDINWGAWTATAAAGSSPLNERDPEEAEALAVTMPEEVATENEADSNWGHPFDNQEEKAKSGGALDLLGLAGEQETQDSEWEIQRARLAGEKAERDAAEAAAAKAKLESPSRFGDLALGRDDFQSEISENFGGEDIEIHPRYGIIYPQTPGRVDDLTRVRGIGLTTEKMLNLEGIYRYKQIASWNASAIEGISTDLELGTRIRDDEWISQAAAWAHEGDLTMEREVDETDYTALINSQYAGHKVEYKRGLGVLYNEAPENPDDLTEIKGIGLSLQSKLNDYGVYRFQQIADWNGINIAAFNERLSFAGRIERDEWVAQAKRFAVREEEEANWIEDSAVIPLPDPAAYDGSISKFDGDDVSVDQALGIVYPQRPEQADDLKQIWGVGSQIENQLNQFGVYRFAQVAEWNEYNVREFNKRLGFKGRIERDEWISQAKRFAEENDALHGKYGAVLSNDYSGDPVTVKPRFGVVYTKQPNDVDDLTEINGIGPVIEKQLNDAGVYRFKQIANWDEDAVNAFEEEIDFPGRITRDQWVLQARDFIGSNVASTTEETEPDKPQSEGYLEALEEFDGENVDIDDKFGIIYTGRPTNQDDLKRIRGVGKYLEEKLNDRGVFRFKQVANWNDYNVWAFGKDLAFPGRITREDWVNQAAELAELEKHRIKAETLAKSKYAGQSVRIDPELGVVYRHRPDQVDDLTRLDGIDQTIASRLNADGIYTYEQVNNLKGPQRKSFLSRFGLGEIDWGSWSALDKKTGDEPGREVKTPPETRTFEFPSIVTPKVEKPDLATRKAGDSGHKEPLGFFGNIGDLNNDEERRVAFIMDVSKSLTPAQLKLSKDELSSAIKSLPEGSHYQVIFFSGPAWFAHQRIIEGGGRGEDVVIQDGDETLHWKNKFGGFEYEGDSENPPSSQWLEVTPDNIESTLADIEAVNKSYGTTWHIPLSMALNLDPPPKHIYFMTDGETARQDEVAEEMIHLSRERGGQTKINTIALMVPGASAPLYQIASQTGGDYSLIIAGGKVLRDEALKDYLSEKNIALND